MPKPVKWDDDYRDLDPELAKDLRDARTEMARPAKPKRRWWRLWR